MVNDIEPAQQDTKGEADGWQVRNRLSDDKEWQWTRADEVEFYRSHPDRFEVRALYAQSPSVQQAAATEPQPPYTLRVPTGDGAVMFIVNPASDPQIGWMLCHASDLNQSRAGRFSAAAIIESFDYLLSANINA